MGFFRGADKIGIISHAAGVISLAASRLTIGGQQYETSLLTRTISTDVTMLSATRYMIYAVVVGGSVQLRISPNFNSVGPSGFTAWKLVGAFMSDGTVTPAFGAFFVSLTGVPTINAYIPYTANIVDSTGAVVTSASPLQNHKEFRVRGKFGLYSGGYYHQGVVGTNGSSIYVVKVPATHTVQAMSTVFPSMNGAGNTQTPFGQAGGDVGGTSFCTGGRGGDQPGSLNGFSLRLQSDADGGNWAPNGAGGSLDAFAMNVANMAMTWGDILVPIAEFSDTPLVDL